MKVFRAINDEARLIGRCDLKDDGGEWFDVAIFGDAKIAFRSYNLPKQVSDIGCADLPERGVLLAADEPCELLPGWTPLAS
jgi:hypothetical protein